MASSSLGVRILKWLGILLLLVVVGVVGLVVGTWIGHIVARVRSGAAARIAELEAQLESALKEKDAHIEAQLVQKDQELI